MAELDLDQLIEGKRGSARRWQWIALGAFVILAIAGAYVLLFRSDGKQVVAAPQQAKATVGALATTLTTSGTAAAEQSSALTFAAGGVLTQVFVKVGDQVKAGQVLAQLDTRDAQRRYESAAASYQQAVLHLEALTNPAATDVIAAQQSVQSARSALASAQANYNALLSPPKDIDVVSADIALQQAKLSLQSATNQMNNAYSSLIAAQTSYCRLGGTAYGACDTSLTVPELPLKDDVIVRITETLTYPNLPAANLVTAASALLQANTSYINAVSSRDSAEASLRSAQSKRDALNQPATPDALGTAWAALQSAQLNLDAAIAKQQALAAPNSTDLGLQQQAVRQAQISLQQAQDALDDLALKAPFAGTVGTLPILVGQRIGAGTTAMVLTNADAIRVDLTVSEADVASLKPGMLGIARFDALSRNTYVVRISGLSTVPTITQGVVTYPVQAAILRGESLTAVRDQVASVVRAVGGANGAQLSGLFGGQGGVAPGQGAQPQGQQGPGQARRTPGAQGSGTPGAGGNGGSGGAGGAAGGLQALLNPPLPSAGMNASITVLLAVTENQLLVPSGAVRRQGGQSFVYVPGENGGAPVQKAVTVGGSDGTNTAITSGLDEGDTVLLGAIGGATPAASSTARQGGTGGAPGAGGGVFIAPGGGGAPGGIR